METLYQLVNYMIPSVGSGCLCSWWSKQLQLPRNIRKVCNYYERRKMDVSLKSREYARMTKEKIDGCHIDDSDDESVDRNMITSMLDQNHYSQIQRAIMNDYEEN